MKIFIINKCSTARNYNHLWTYRRSLSRWYWVHWSGDYQGFHDRYASRQRVSYFMDFSATNNFDSSGNHNESNSAQNLFFARAEGPLVTTSCTSQNVIINNVTIDYYYPVFGANALTAGAPTATYTKLNVNVSTKLRIIISRMLYPMHRETPK